MDQCKADQEKKGEETRELLQTQKEVTPTIIRKSDKKTIAILDKYFFATKTKFDARW